MSAEKGCLQKTVIKFEVLDFEVLDQAYDKILKIEINDVLQGGDNMYSQFDILRSSAGYESPMKMPASCGQSVQKISISSHAPSFYQEPQAPEVQDQVHAMTGQDNANSSTDNYMDIAFMLQMLDSHHNPMAVPTTQYITPKMMDNHHPVGVPKTQYITPKMLDNYHSPVAVPTTQYITPKINPVGVPQTQYITSKMLESHHNPMEYITPKIEPQDIPNPIPSHLMSPPSYPGSDHSMSPPPYPGLDHPMSPPSYTGMTGSPFYMGLDHSMSPPSYTGSYTDSMSPQAYTESDLISELGTVVGSDFGTERGISFDFMDDEEVLSTGSPFSSPPSCASSSCADEEDEETRSGRVSSPTRPRTNIHLWQFIKELLLQPQHYGNYIHWIDRQKGIFKILDSVKVATLWGKRKNRPAMNYDKLSRSLRQYYKKGIMKKTEQSQRLVYQFCHPYHL